MNLEDIAESDEHAQWIVEEHGRSVRFGMRARCTLCEEWWPCDRAGLAALAMLRVREVTRLREQLRIAEDILGSIAHQCDRSTCGAVVRDVAYARTLADDALTRMSVVE